MLVEVIKETLLITGFVLIMMLLLEYLTVRSKGKWSKPFQKYIGTQIILGALLGCVPGCVGTFMAVSLYSHGLLTFSALVAASIAAVGDEAFVMFSLIPYSALKLTLLIFGIGIISGFVVHFFVRNKKFMLPQQNHLVIHENESNCISFNRKIFLEEIKNFSFHRSLLVSLSLLFIFAIAVGGLGEEDWNIEKIVFLLISFCGLFIVSTVPEHFLQHHLWEHVIKKHFLRIFLWTFGAFLLIGLFENYLNIEKWMSQYPFYTLLIAALVGIIPESGPHIIFITLFAKGAIPFTTLLVNSIVQDGHGTIPLLAESRKSFFILKFINLIIGLLVGFIGFTFF